MVETTNILFITHYPGMYGANLSLCTLIKELRASYNIEPIVLLSSRGDICEFLEQNDIKYYVFHFYWWVNADSGIFQKFLNYRKQIRNILSLSELLRELEQEKIDLIYSNSVTINIGVSLSRKLRCPHIWHLRETMQAYDFKYSIGNFLVKRVFAKGADRYIVISDFLFNSYKNYLPLIITKRIYNGVTLDVEDKSTNSFTTVLNIAIIGILCDQKNQLDALKALKILMTKEINQIKLHFIGGSKEEYLIAVKKYIVENELTENVIFYGHQKDVNRILSSMNVGLVCARDEAFGRASIEYMLHGMPVIASKSGANEELVLEGENGLLYELYQVEELAEKMIYFLDNPAMVQKMGTRARHYATSNFSSAQNTDAIYQVIEELVPGKKS